MTDHTTPDDDFPCCASRAHGDPLRDELEAIRERAKPELIDGRVDLDNPRPEVALRKSQADVPRLLAAVEVVLDLYTSLSTPTMHDSDRQAGRIEGLRAALGLIERALKDA